MSCCATASRMPRLPRNCSAFSPVTRWTALFSPIPQQRAPLNQQFAPHLPTVLLGTPASLSGDEVNSVCIDNLAGGRLAAEYLLSLGHRSIAYLGHRSGSLTHQLRLRGFMEVLGKEGLTPTVIENTADSSSIGAGYELSRKLFNEGCPHTAIFAATDSLALGAMQAADEFGIAIPDDLSLLGFDNIIYSSLPKITLSTIDQKVSARRGCGRYPHPDHRVR